MAKRTVLIDTYAWTTPVEGVPGRYQHNIAHRGDEIDVTDDEAKRGEQVEFSTGVRAFPALGDEHQLAEVTNDATAVAGAGIDLATLAEMSLVEVRDYVEQNPDQRDHVIELERTRGSDARKGVLSLAG